MIGFARKQWFALGLIIVFAVVLSDTTQTVAGVGQWLKARHGPDLVITFIFFLSGLGLDGRLLKKGLSDATGTALALTIIFVISPLVAVALCALPLPMELEVGLLLVAVMPTTLSSGVVMTNASGGNMAHALLITIIASTCAVFTIPIVLSWCLPAAGLSVGMFSVDRSRLMARIALFVLLPLFTGLALRFAGAIRNQAEQHKGKLSAISQVFVLMIVFMAAAQSRQTILDSGRIAAVIVVLVAAFHTILLGGGWALIRLAGLGPGRRESILFMGAQKTLPLAVILQLILFPQYGTVLVVCVLHHFVHLVMDGFLVGVLRPSDS